jgi:phage anti-repressor protein
MENQLPQIIKHNGKQAVSARELYKTLGFNKSQWSRWSKKNITSNSFAIENQDWTGFDTMSNGNEVTDYVLTIDFAKRLAMLARTESGERVRKYFIECEQRAKEMIKLPTSLVDAQVLIGHAQKLGSIEHRLNELEAHLVTSPKDYYAIAGFASLKKIPLDVSVAVRIGTKAKAMCRSLGYITGTIPDPRFGKVNTYPYEVLENIFHQFFPKQQLSK